MSDLDRLFYWRGIAPDFYSFRGELTPVPIENRLKILQAMGVDTSSPESIAREAFDLDIKPWLSWLPPLEVVKASEPTVNINFHPDELSLQFNWCISQDDDTLQKGTFAPSELAEVGNYIHQGVRYSRRSLPVEALPPNYYHIALCRGDKREVTQLAIVPERAYSPDWVDQDDVKLWGFVIQLYTLRSNTNWGIGDFSDLAQLIEKGAQFGVDIIGLNPFHALQTDLKHNFSPYSPSDRRFLNPLYIDVPLSPGYDDEFRDDERIAFLRQEPFVDYEAMRALKYTALYACFEVFAAESTQALAEFVAEAPASLIDFINYEVASNWQPEDVLVQPVRREPFIKALNSESSALPPEMILAGFHAYLQWVATTQLEQCQALAESKQMKVGLVRDLAVGASGGGAEVQTSGHLFCHDASVGAPPDPLALTGQNWGIPPMDPAELRRTAFSHYIDLLRENMAHCGALRIDHAMSLYRLWWCPPGATADKGAYIYYPLDEMIGLLCLESHLKECVVIAEDLGVVPDEFRAAIAQVGFFSNRVFYFEKWSDTEFKHPTEYEPHALAMLDNHDVPTITSWWNGSDLSLRYALDLLEANTDMSDLIAHRMREKQNLVKKLSDDGLLPEHWLGAPLDHKIDQALVNAIVLYASQAKSKFYILQLEDLLLMDDPVNVPGTFLEHRNWSRKLHKSLEDIFSDTGIQSTLRAIAIKRSE